MADDRWLRAAALRVRSLFRRRAVEAELSDELAYHVEQQIDLLRTRGMSATDARTEALRAMGGIERRKEECRAERRTGFAEHLAADVRYAFRRLRRTPGFTAVALITLALGLGANAAIFTVVHGVLMTPLDYNDPGKLVVPMGTVAAADFLDWRASNRTLASVGAAEWWTPTLSSSAGTARPEQLSALHVSTDVFPMLGVPALLGRVPRPDEEHSGAAPVVVISYGSWQRRFAGDSNVVGKSMTFDGVQHTIIGVMPQRFRFAPYWATQAELWAPLMLDDRKTDRNGSSLRVFGRLADGTTIAQAREDLASIIAPVDSAHAAFARRLRVVPLFDLVVEDVQSALQLLQGAVLLLLLIACANVAHLQLMRAAAAERESAVRVALGASTARVVQQSLVESLMLCGAGALLGLGLGYAGVRALIAFAPPLLPRVDAIRFEPSVFAVLAATAAGAAVICGLVPALRMANVRVGDAMRAGRGWNDTPRRRRVRGALVVSEFAMTLVLLVGAGLVLRSFAALTDVPTGFDAHRAVSMQVSLDGTAHADVSKRFEFFEELGDRVRALPGVESVGLVNHIPIGGDNWRFPFSIEGRPAPAAGSAERALFRVAAPGYFGAMRVPLTRGRDFSVQDQRALAHVVIINETMARRQWAGADPIGQRLSVDDPATHPDWFTVVGVVRDLTQAHLADETLQEMFFPYLPPQPDQIRGSLATFLTPRVMTLVIRGTDTTQTQRAAAAIAAEMDRDAAVSNVATLDAMVAGQFVQPRFYVILFGSFAVVALVLALVGVYGVISYSVAQRTRELGVRAALGATNANAFALVMRQGMLLAAVGCTIGIVGALAGSRVARALLFHVQPTDLVTFIAVPVVLWAASLLACYVPARRAARVDPMVALRNDG